MKRMAGLVVALLLASPSALAATAAGNSALALAALVAERSPLVRPLEKRVMARLFDGQINFDFAAGKKISVQADAIACVT